MASLARGALALAVIGLLAGGATAAEDAGYIGVQVKKGETGIEVVSVLDDGPAAKAKLQANDIIRKVDGKAVDDLMAFVNLMHDTKPGTKLTLAVHRDGKDIEIKVTVEKRPES